MAKSPKFYVVTQGHRTGIFNTWAECKAAVDNFTGARYKSYETRAEAEKALQEGIKFQPSAGGKFASKKVVKVSPDKLPKVGLAVDAACSGNPGPMEYRGVDLSTGKEVFHFGPVVGTNNIGEFLAIVHGLALLQKLGSDWPIYSDSVNALNWVKQKNARTKLERTTSTEATWQMIDRALVWLRNNRFANPLLKWPTDEWGEIPADFGRK